jgi:hypothetical protein
MMVGWAPALYMYALIFGLSVASLVRLCGRLLTMAMTGLEDRRAAAIMAGNSMRSASSR